MSSLTILVIIIVCIALVFDFLNGFHDAANAIATIVVTRTLTPMQAILLAGIANFTGYFTFGVAVAKTIGKGVVTIDSVATPEIKLIILLSALLGAVVWNIMTWLLGLPTSSSHALIGGLIGAAVASAGFGVVILGGVIKIVIFIVVAPVIGMLGASIFTTVIMMLFRKSNPKKMDRHFRRFQIFASLINGVGHGTNDAQKTMGVIALALFAGGITDSFQLQGWIVLSCYCAISLGTVFGGWRIVKTMGTQIAKIRPMDGFSSSISSAFVLLGTAHVGIPVSTTHVITGSIMGVGAVEHAAKVRWITARKIVWAWILTIPLTALCAALTYYFLHSFLHRGLYHFFVK